MNKTIALSLQNKAKQIAENFSNPNKDYNYSKETFTVHKIIPLSEKTAAIVFNKSSGKKALAFAYYILMNGGIWNYFFITYDHLGGLERLGKILQEIEEHNFSFN